MITSARVRELLTYDPLTGEFHWRVARGQCQPGDKAGAATGNYILIGIDGKRYYAHRLAVLYMTGSWPVRHVDHKRGWNNAWDNLREATPAQNLANRGPQKNNTTGFKGVWKNGSGWCAVIGTGATRQYLGQYRTPEEASTAYLEGARRIYGEFGRG